MVTPRQFAEQHGVAYTTVMSWLQRELVPGAQKQALPEPFVGHTYRIPEDAKPPDLKPGPKPGARKRARRKTTGK